MYTKKSIYIGDKNIYLLEKRATEENKNANILKMDLKSIMKSMQ